VPVAVGHGEGDPPGLPVTDLGIAREEEDLTGGDDLEGQHETGVVGLVVEVEGELSRHREPILVDPAPAQIWIGGTRRRPVIPPEEIVITAAEALVLGDHVVLVEGEREPPRLLVLGGAARRRQSGGESARGRQPHLVGVLAMFAWQQPPHVLIGGRRPQDEHPHAVDTRHRERGLAGREIALRGLVPRLLQVGQSVRRGGAARGQAVPGKREDLLDGGPQARLEAGTPLRHGLPYRLELKAELVLELLRPRVAGLLRPGQPHLVDGDGVEHRLGLHESRDVVPVLVRRHDDVEVPARGRLQVGHHARHRGGRVLRAHDDATVDEHMHRLGPALKGQ